MCSENLSCFRRQLLCIRCHVFALKTAQTGRRMRQVTLAAPRGEKVKFGPYRQKKTLEASASRVVVEHRGVEPRLASLRSLGQVRNSRLPFLSFGILLCSPGFRLALSATGGARLRPSPMHRIVFGQDADAPCPHKQIRAPVKGVRIVCGA